MYGKTQYKYQERWGRRKRKGDGKKKKTTQLSHGAKKKGRTADHGQKLAYKKVKDQAYFATKGGVHWVAGTHQKRTRKWRK